MATISKRLALRFAALTAATVGLSGCYYDMGLGYASDPYGYYDCDPYAQWDSYYACDSGYGFYNIGFGGGWYDNYWYPGYGYYIFDNRGYRYNMGDHHRRYWGDRRQRWYRDNYNGRDGHHGGGKRHRRGKGHGYNHYDGGDVNQPIGWPEKHGGRRDERAGHAPEPGGPPPQAVGNGNWDHPRNGGGKGKGHGGRKGHGGGGQGGWQGDQNGPAAVNTPQPQPQPGNDRGGRGGWGNGGNGGGNGGNGGGGGGRGNWQPPQGGQSASPPPPSAPPPAPRADPPRHSPPVHREAPDRLPD
jgi:hypothetical protein